MDAAEELLSTYKKAESCQSGVAYFALYVARVYLTTPLI